MNLKYGPLRILINCLYGGAGIIALLGLVTLSGFNGDNLMTLIPLITCLVIAFNFVVMAQLITVFIDMEWNQRETNELLEQVIKNLPQVAIEEEAV